MTDKSTSCGACDDCTCDDDTTNQMGKPLTVKFAPGVLEEIMATMTPDDAQDLVDQIYKLASSGDLLEQSTPVDMDELESTDPELFAHITEQLHAAGTPIVTH